MYFITLFSKYSSDLVMSKNIEILIAQTVLNQVKLSTNEKDI